MKHTPGPWIYEEERTGKGAVSHFIFEGDCEPDTAACIAHVQFINGAEANAKLIAAAPELLEAAKQVVASNKVGIPEEDYWLEPLIKAIAKAVSHE